jgi:hypothetical protein
LVSRSAVAIQFHHEATKHAKVREVVRALEGGAALVLSCFTPRRQDAKKGQAVLRISFWREAPMRY